MLIIIRGPGISTNAILVGPLLYFDSIPRNHILLLKDPILMRVGREAQYCSWLSASLTVCLVRAERVALRSSCTLLHMLNCYITDFQAKRHTASDTVRLCYCRLSSDIALCRVATRRHPKATCGNGGKLHSGDIYEAHYGLLDPKDPY